MKTSKFMYNVGCYDLVNGHVCDIKCVTLAEARLIAARYYMGVITCIGEVKYINGVEVL